VVLGGGVEETHEFFLPHLGWCKELYCHIGIEFSVLVSPCGSKMEGSMVETHVFFQIVF
jgi:hypothetical protein